MNTLKFNYSNPINDVFQANNQTIISNRYHYRSPYRSRFQYPPLISNLTNPNISPQLKSLINSSPTLKALSQSFLPSIPNNTEPIEETEKKSVLEPISEKKQSVTKKKTPKKEKLPKLQPIKEQKTNQQQNITPRKRNNIRFSNETTNVNQLNVNKSKTTISLPTIKATNSLKDKSSPRTQASTVRSINQSEKQSHQNQHQQNQQKHRRDSFTQRYVDEHEPRSTSSQNRNLESEMSERISSSKASCRSNNSKKMDLRFGSLLSEEGNYAMLKTYEDMIYQELLSLYPHLVTKQIQMYRTATQDFQMLPTKFPPSKQQNKLPLINELSQKKKKSITNSDLENLELTIHKSNISRHLDQAMKIYDAIKLMKGQLTTYGNNFNFKNDQYLLNAFIEWKNNWHSVTRF